MMNAIGAASRQASIAEEKLLALALAKNVLEISRAEARATGLSNGTDTSAPTDTGIKYPVELKRIVTSVSGYTDLKSVTARVTWTSPSGQEHSGKVELQTYVVNND